MCSRPQHSAEAGTVCGEQLMTWTNGEQWNQGQESVWLPVVIVVQTFKSRVSVQLGWGEVWFRDPKAVMPGWENEKLFRGNNLFKSMA